MDHRQAGSDVRLGRAGQAVVDLVLQEVARLGEQVELNEALGEAADHLVAAPAGRGEVLEVEIERDRVEARDRIALVVEEQGFEARPRLVVESARDLVLRIELVGAPRHAEGVAPAALLGVEPAEQPERADFHLVAAPGDQQALQPGNGGLAVDRLVAQREGDAGEPRARLDGPVGRARKAVIGGERVFDAPLPLGDARLDIGDEVAVDDLRREALDRLDDALAEAEVAGFEGRLREERRDLGLEILGVVGECRLAAAEADEGLRPAPLLRLGIGAPQLRLGVLLEVLRARIFTASW